MDGSHVTRAFPASAKPLVLPPIRSAGPCASCGQPLTVAGSGVLRHQRTGTVSCHPVLDEVDGGWCEPDGWADGPCATFTAPVVALAAARQLAYLAAIYGAPSTGRRAVTRRHAADGCRALAGYLTIAGRAGHGAA